MSSSDGRAERRLNVAPRVLDGVEPEESFGLTASLLKARRSKRVGSCIPRAGIVVEAVGSTVETSLHVLEP